MKEVIFNSGKKFCIKDIGQESYILMFSSDEEEQYTLLNSYIEVFYLKPKFEYLIPFSKKVFKDEMNKEDYEKVEEYFFKDVEKYGEENLCKKMAEFKMVMFYVHNGMPVPNGPLSWE